MQRSTWLVFLHRLLGIAAPTMLLAGCVPFFADQQSARILPVGKTELTPSFSYVYASSEGETEHIRNQYGARLGYGLSPMVEVRATFEHSALTDVAGGGNFNLFALGAKFGLVPGRVALYLPIGFGTGEGLKTSDTWTVAPTLLATWRSSPQFELTPSLKAIYPFAIDDPEMWVGVHLGAAISSDLERWALRPEVGLVKNPGDEGTTWGFALGVSIRP